MREQPKILLPAPWRTRLLAWLTVRVVTLLCLTLRVQIDGEDEANRIVREGGAMQVAWHGRVLYPVNRWRGRNYNMLVSLSNDGDLLSEYMVACGLKVIRGSSSRRAAGVTIEALRILKNGGVVAFTPDGPRGPAQVVQSGVIYLAQKSGKPILYAGISAWPRWQTRSWDTFTIPKPFARLRWIYGEPFYVGANDDPEEARVRLEKAINDLQEQAEHEARFGKAAQGSREPVRELGKHI